MSRRGPVLGCIADDFTGAVDVAAGVFEAGQSTVIVTADEPGPRAAEADVVVIALKSRTVPVHEAVARSRDAAEALRRIGVRQLMFKYCSTFDSTPQGNIGPVADALVELDDQPVTVVVPGYPANARTVRDGLLYVGNVLLSDSPMRDHPLTPMTCSDVPALLRAQSRYPVALIDLGIVRRGPAAIIKECGRLAHQGARYAVLDTVTDADIDAIAGAISADGLVTGGAAIAHALARSAAAPNETRPPRSAPDIPRGRRVVLSGSCSSATQAQVAEFARTGSVLQLDPRQLADPETAAAEAAGWAVGCPADGPVLISTTATADQLHSVHDSVGRDASSARVEAFFAAVARRLLAHGFDRMLVAGGETSGAVTLGLGVREIVATTTISPGLAWCVSERPAVALALKSGNFGAPDIFTRAHEIFDEAQPVRREASRR